MILAPNGLKLTCGGCYDGSVANPVRSYFVELVLGFFAPVTVKSHDVPQAGPRMFLTCCRVEG
jgi:hypothetical protein